MEEGAADELILAYVRPPTASPEYKNQRADSLLSMSDASSMNGDDGKNYQIALIRRFDFSSKLQRMSVIVKNFMNSSFRSYVKGSPEKIRELCTPQSLPSNFDEVLTIYTECGYRVLALATKPLNINFLKAQKIQRDEVENNVEFLGFLVM
jgi:cation-transporting ATPase 13A2